MLEAIEDVHRPLCSRVEQISFDLEVCRRPGQKRISKPPARARITFAKA